MWILYLQKRVYTLNSKRKHSERRNKFINFQRECFVEQPTNKIFKM